MWGWRRPLAASAGDSARPQRSAESLPDPDAYFAEEATAGRALDWSVAVVDHDAVETGEADRAVRRVPAAAGDALYRGWMLRSEHYAAFLDRVGHQGRAAAHQRRPVPQRPRTPGVVSPLPRPHPAASVWMNEPGTDGLVELVKTLPPGPAIIKDWVKSMKHYWDEAVYLPDVGDPDAARRVAGRFVDLRGKQIVGGIVVRSFERYEPGEVRS